MSKEETLEAGEQNTKFIAFPKSLSEIPPLIPHFLMKPTRCDFSISSHIFFCFKANSLGFLLSGYLEIGIAMSLFSFTNEGLFFWC